MSAATVHEFKIELENSALTLVKSELKGVKNFGISIDGSREEWTTLGEDGWKSNLVTTKGFTASMVWVIDYTDPTHKKIIKDVIFGRSRNHNGFTITVTFPKTSDSVTTAATLTFEGSLNPSNAIGGEASSVSEVTLEVMANGKPTYTEEVTK